MSELDQQFMMDSHEMAADRMIAMNPSGMVEMYQNHPEGGHGQDQGQEECPGGVCPMPRHEREEPMSMPAEVESKPVVAKTSTSTSWTTYLMYLVILLVILAAGYFGYKYFMCKEWFFNNTE